MNFCVFTFFYISNNSYSHVYFYFSVIIFSKILILTLIQWTLDDTKVEILSSPLRNILRLNGQSCKERVQHRKLRIHEDPYVLKSGNRYVWCGKIRRYRVPVL